MSKLKQSKEQGWGRGGSADRQPAKAEGQEAGHSRGHQEKECGGASSSSVSRAGAEGQASEGKHRWPPLGPYPEVGHWCEQRRHAAQGPSACSQVFAHPLCQLSQH